MKNSKKLFLQANKYIPGGVNSQVRAFSSVNSSPFFVKRAKGQYLFDEDGNKYIDFIGSWGAQILGHSDDRILKVLNKTMKDGITYGAPCQNEVLIAKKVCQIYKSIEKIRMVNSGTEATMSAIRLARGYTGKDKIIKFNGCYHGHGDSFLIKAGSGASTYGTPDSLGVTKANARNTISIEYNNIDAVNNAIKGGGIASIIIEHIAGNMNFIRARKSFLQYLRNVCTKNNIVLIFDEVITWFMVSKAGAQHIYNVMPDLTTLGKVLGGGLPVGAFGGKREIMNHIAPLGSVYQAGTLSGNPLAMAAGLKTLEIISEKNYFRDLSKKTQYFVSRFNDICSKYKLDMSADSEGGMFGIYLTKSKLESLKDIDKSPKHIFLDFFNYILDHGVFFAPSMYEAGFISSSHLKRDLDYTIKIFENWAKQK